VRAVFIILMIGQWLMGSSIEKIEVDGIEVPIIYEADHRLPIVSMQVVFQNSGSIADGDLKGLSNLVANVYNQGTTKMSATEFAEQLDAKAIDLNVHAGTETFVFDLESLKEHFDEGIVLLTSLFQHPNITEEALDKVKATLSGKIARKQDDLDYMASEHLKVLMYANTPLDHSTLGTMQLLEEVELDHVNTFVKKHIVLEGAIIVIGGDISLDDAKEKAKNVVKLLSHGHVDALPHFRASDLNKSEHIYKQSEQAYVYFGAPYDVNATADDRYIGRVATFILGAGGFGSRMMEEIRVKRGLAYSAYCSVSTNRTTSSFKGHLQTKIESEKEAISAVNALITEYVKQGATQAELDQAKKFLLGSEPLRVETISQRLSRAFLEYYKGLTLGESAKELKKIEALELKDLNAFIKKHDEILSLSYAIVTREPSK